MGTYITQLTASMKCTSSSISCAGGQSFVFTVTGSGLSNPFNTKSLNGGIITLATE
jgi:hypothetical protein